MPGPSSCTSRTRLGPSRGDPHLHRRAGGVCTSALPTRLATTWRSRPSSPVDGDALGDRRSDRAVGIDGAGVADRVDGEHAEIDRLRLERAALVEPGEEQQVVDERAHAHRFLLGAAHRLRELLGVVEAAAAVELGVPADRGHRRAQLVRRVGDELAQARLRRGALVERVLDLRRASC